MKQGGTIRDLDMVVMTASIQVRRTIDEIRSAFYGTPDANNLSLEPDIGNIEDLIQQSLGPEDASTIEAIESIERGNVERGLETY